MERIDSERARLVRTVEALQLAAEATEMKEDALQVAIEAQRCAQENEKLRDDIGRQAQELNRLREVREQFFNIEIQFLQ